MRNIVITGATGNVGRALIELLSQKRGDFKIWAALKSEAADQDFLQQYPVECIAFDFDVPESAVSALKNCDTLFLLRPPHISDVKKYFRPLIATALAQQVKHLVFLSVQGAESSSLIPHHKIEKLIVESGIPYTFLRPAYFMQNFSTTLRHDIVEKGQIFLPAGTAKFTLIDVEDVAAVAAEVLAYPEAHAFQAYELTNNEQLSFGEMAAVLSDVLGKEIRYISPNLIHFYYKKRAEGMPAAFVLVMIMLHYLPRFKAVPSLSGSVAELTGKAPRSFRDFVKANKAMWQ
jgi:uncharacterized protein YbjT (DUF2867 family)